MPPILITLLGSLTTILLLALITRLVLGQVIQSFWKKRVFFHDPKQLEGKQRRIINLLDSLVKKRIYSWGPLKWNAMEDVQSMLVAFQIFFHPDSPIREGAIPMKFPLYRLLALSHHLFQEIRLSLDQGLFRLLKNRRLHWLFSGYSLFKSLRMLLERHPVLSKIVEKVGLIMRIRLIGPILGVLSSLILTPFFGVPILLWIVLRGLGLGIVWETTLRSFYAYALYRVGYQMIFLYKKGDWGEWKQPPLPNKEGIKASLKQFRAIQEESLDPQTPEAQEARKRLDYIFKKFHLPSPKGEDGKGFLGQIGKIGRSTLTGLKKLNPWYKGRGLTSPFLLTWMLLPRAYARGDLTRLWGSRKISLVLLGLDHLVSEALHLLQKLPGIMGDKGLLGRIEVDLTIRGKEIYDFWKAWLEDKQEKAAPLVLGTKHAWKVYRAQKTLVRGGRILAFLAKLGSKAVPWTAIISLGGELIWHTTSHYFTEELKSELITRFSGVLMMIWERKRGAPKGPLPQTQEEANH